MIRSLHRSDGGRDLLIHVYWAHRRDADTGLEGILNQQERLRLNSIKCTDTAVSFLMGRSLLRRTVGHLLGCAPEHVRVELSAGTRGKPLLPGTDWEVSLSHSGPWVGLAITKGTAIGLDIEVVNEDWDPLPVTPMVLTPDEQRELLDIESSDRPWLFTRLWTRKEAVMKAIGKGLSPELSRTQVSTPYGTPVVCALPPSLQSQPPIRLVDLQDRPGALSSLAALTSGLVQVREHDGTALIRLKPLAGNVTRL
ncbi:4'-phosphopantetheinyl transferase superfamily protein [Pseudarthrobacter polychromogenes]